MCATMVRTAATADFIEATRSRAWAITSWKRQGCGVYIYFDNDQKSAAPADALKLKRLLP